MMISRSSRKDLPERSSIIWHAYYAESHLSKFEKKSHWVFFQHAGKSNYSNYAVFFILLFAGLTEYAKLGRFKRYRASAALVPSSDTVFRDIESISETK